jgi:hypothetical protein
MRLSLLLVLLFSGGCGMGVSWSHHSSFRSTGKELRLAHIDADEIVQGAVSANLHYVSLALDSVFVRNLPGLIGRNVAVGIEIKGVLDGGKAIQTVFDLKKGVGEHGFLALDNLAVVEPFLYTGRNLTLTLHFRAVADDDVSHIRGRLAGAGEIVKRLHPQRQSALEAGVDLFRSILGSVAKKELSWKYQFTLYPADSVYRDKPELLLTAARHILLIGPPGDAPSELRALRPSKVMRYLRMRGNRLVWAHDGAEYVETPYIVLNITRYKRYPSPNTELRKLARTVDDLIENGNLDGAKGVLPQLAVAINQDPIITSREKNLERSWKDFREARIAWLQARKAKDAGLELAHAVRQLKHLTNIRTQFSNILYPFETKDLDFRVNQLVLATEILAKQSGLDASEVMTLAGAYKATVARFSEPPPAVAKAEPPPIDLAREPPPPRPRWKKTYEKWWFWTLVSVGAAGIGAATYGLTRPSAGPNDLAYPSHTLGGFNRALVGGAR